MPCGAGRFAKKKARLACTACEQGLFARGNGSWACEACAVGKHSGAGASACAACAAGRSDHDLNPRTPCAFCAGQQRAKSLGAGVFAGCEGCPLNQEANEATGGVCRCREGWYNRSLYAISCLREGQQLDTATQFTRAPLANRTDEHCQKATTGGEDCIDVVRGRVLLKPGSGLSHQLHRRRDQPLLAPPTHAQSTPLRVGGAL